MPRGQNCHSYDQILSAYLDGDLTHGERAELMQHLATCEDCRRILDEYRAIGTQLRALPALHSPDDLTDAIYAQTVDAPPRRLFLLTNRIGYPVAAIAAVLLVFIVAVFLLVDGYERRIDPTIVGSDPAANAMWSPTNPIRITFNKSMDRESVEAALAIQPTSERRNLDFTWEGNTLIIGETRTLKSGTEYEVRVTTDARDKWGKPLSEPFELAFATTTNVQLSDSEPTAEPTPSPTEQPENEVATTASRTATSVPATATPQPDNRSSDPPATSTTVPPATATGPPSTGSGEGSNGDPQPPADNPPPVEEPDPTSTPTEPPLPTPTETPEPVPTEAPEEPTAVPPTETPEATATPEPEPTEVPATPTVPEATPTPETIAVAGSFGNVYWSNELVQSGLGMPLDVERPIDARELDFQRGKMFQNLDSSTIYVMETAGFWSSVLDTSGDDLPEFVETSEEGIWEPGGVFGYIWQQDSYVQDTLQYAVEGQTQEFMSVVQEFENGMMLSSADGFIYVLYTGDNSWELYPDAGPLSDDDESSSEP